MVSKGERVRVRRRRSTAGVVFVCAFAVGTYALMSAGAAAAPMCAPLTPCTIDNFMSGRWSQTVTALGTWYTSLQTGLAGNIIGGVRSTSIIGTTNPYDLPLVANIVPAAALDYINNGAPHDILCLMSTTSDKPVATLNLMSGGSMVWLADPRPDPFLNFTLF